MDREDNTMKISEWLDSMEKQGLDVAHIVLPEELSYDEAPEETLYYKEVRPCGILCPGNHPFATVERFGHWYHCRGQDRKAGIHAEGMEWSLFTRDKERALQTARSHIEP